MGLFRRKEEKNNKREKNRRIRRSKEIIKKERARIRDEKKKQRLEARKNNRVLKFFKKIFCEEENVAEYKPQSLKSQILSMIYFEIIGAVMCLLVLFVLSGGENYIKLYSELSKLISTYDTITSEYYGEIDKDELIDTAIASMVDSVGDSYTNYSDEETTNSFMENVSGTYEGIGASVATDEDGNIVVVEVFSDSPAAEAGLKEGDIITYIDGESYEGKTSTDASDYIKSSTSDKVILTVVRDDANKEITITRDEIEIQTVTSDLIEEDDKKIGYLYISIFSSVTAEQFEEELEELEDNDIDGLIIDVRNNSGGYLSTVTDIASLFLKKGKVIYQLSDDGSTTKVKDETKAHRTYPVAVLVNNSSASASEILAASIKESYNGYVVGTNTYGKGTVQKTKTLSDGSMIKYTIEKWLTPDGNWVNEVGVEPTDYVELDTTIDGDNQLDTAVSVIVDKLNG